MAGIAKGIPLGLLRSGDPILPVSDHIRPESIQNTILHRNIPYPENFHRAIVETGHTVIKKNC